MNRFQTLALLSGLGAAVGGCAQDMNHPASEANRTLYSQHQPVVQRTDYVLDVNGSDNGLSAQERTRLDAWFKSLGIGYGDRIWVDEAWGPSRARADVARLAAGYGVLIGDGAPVTEGEVPYGTLRVIVSRSTASVPNCPDWEGAGGPSSTSPNFGCATNSNIAAMIADPNDLVLGQSGSLASDAHTATKAIKVYRDAQPTGTKGLKESTSRGQ